MFLILQAFFDIQLNPILKNNSMKLRHEVNLCFSALLIAGGATMCFPLQALGGNRAVVTRNRR